MRPVPALPLAPVDTGRAGQAASLIKEEGRQRLLPGRACRARCDRPRHGHPPEKRPERAGGAKTVWAGPAKARRASSVQPPATKGSPTLPAGRLAGRTAAPPEAGAAGEDLAERAARPRHKHALAFRTHHAAGQDMIDRRAAGQRTEKDDRLPRGRGSRPKREDVLMVRGYGEGGGCSCEPRQDQGGLPCRICCPPEAGRDDLGLWICLSREGPAGARGIPGRGRSSRGLHFVERELRLKVAVKGGCCFREPGRQEELPARYFFLPLAGFSAY